MYLSPTSLTKRRHDIHLHLSENEMVTKLKGGGGCFSSSEFFYLQTTSHNSEYPTIIHQHFSSHLVLPGQLNVTFSKLETSGTHSSWQGLGIRVAYSPVSSSEWRAARCISTPQSFQ